MIYLDNAATTLHKPPQVIQAVLEAMQTMGNGARGLHEGSLKAAHTVYAAREKLAKLFNCERADHVVFTSNVTEALNIAITGIISSGDAVITTDIEHNSVLRPLYRLEEEENVRLDFVRSDRHGNIDYNEFESLIRPNTRAIICTHASNLTGNVLDIGKIGSIAKKHNLVFIVDAAQTAGVKQIDMQAMNIDVLCFTGHKGLMGPQGTGGLCIREGIKIRPLIVGGTGVQTYSKSQPHQLPVLLEAGTLNGHGIAGLSAAIDFLNETGISNIYEHEIKLAKRFYNGIKDIPNVKVYGDFSSDARVGIVTLNIAEEDSGEISDILYNDYDIATRAGAHCAPRMHEALGTKEQGAVRFSFSWYNTEQDADAAITAVTEIATQ